MQALTNAAPKPSTAEKTAVYGHYIIIVNGEPYGTDRKQGYLLWWSLLHHVSQAGNARTSLCHICSFNHFIKFYCMSLSESDILSGYGNHSSR